MSSSKKRRRNRSDSSKTGPAFGVDLYLSQLQTPLLSQEEELELIARCKQGDEEARKQLIAANLRFVVRIAQEFRSRGRGLSLQDLIEEGNIGLITAVPKYDPKKNSRFCTYASYWIRQTIHRAVLSSTTIHLPAYMNEILSKWHRAVKYLEAELHRKPTCEEIGRRIGLKPSKLPRILRALGSYSKAPATNSPEEDSPECYIDEKAKTPETLFQEQDSLRLMRRGFAQLTEREATVLRLRFGLDGNEVYTLREVGRQLNLTRERVRQIEIRAKRRLRSSIEGRELHPNMELLENRAVELEDTNDKMEIFDESDE